MTKSKTQNPLHIAPTPIDGGNEMNDALEEYVLSHSAPEPEYLYRLYRDTNVRLLHGRMASGHLQGRLLKMLVEMAKPRNVIEVGTFSGYSALCIAEGLGKDGHLYTFEINDEQEDFTRPWIEGSEHSDKITFIIGDAITEAPKVCKRENIMFDMAFLDGDKRTYVETYDMLMPLMSPGSFILADNTLWDGHVCDPTYDRDKQTIGIREFNDHVANDPRVEPVIVPLRDGLTIIRKTFPPTPTDLPPYPHRPSPLPPPIKGGGVE